MQTSNCDVRVHCARLIRLLRCPAHDFYTHTPDFHFKWREFIKVFVSQISFFAPKHFCGSRLAAPAIRRHMATRRLEIGRVHFPRETPKTTNCGCIDFLGNLSNAYGYLYHTISRNKLTRRLSSSWRRHHMFSPGKGLRPTENNPRLRRRLVRPKRILRRFLNIPLCYPPPPYTINNYYCGGGP